MTDNFDTALNDLGFESGSFSEKNFFSFTLQRDDGTEIAVSLYRDEPSGVLRFSVFTNNKLPATFSRQFFLQFAGAALEPMRGGVGIGIPENQERLCVFFSLPMSSYLHGTSVLVLEKLLEQAEKWDEMLCIAAG